MFAAGGIGSTVLQPKISEDEDRRVVCEEDAGLPRLSIKFRGYLSEIVSQENVAEFVGSFLLCFTFMCNLLAGTMAGWNNLSWGCALCALTYSFSGASGALFNPAISIAVGLSQGGGWGKLQHYVLLQFLGSGLGALAACQMYGTVAPDLGPDPYVSVSFWAGPVTELALTTFLCFVYLNVDLGRRNNPIMGYNQFNGLAIALVAMSGGTAGRLVGGGTMNPAITFAWCVATMDWTEGSLLTCIACCVCHAIAAVFAAVLFRVIRPENRANENKFLTYVPGVYERGLAEFFGTLAVTFTVGVFSSKDREDGPFAHGMIMAAMVYAVADVSGGYFNPGVTFAVWLSGRKQIHLRLALVYMLCQCVGAFIGGQISLITHAGRYDKLWWEPDAENLRKASWAEAVFACGLSYTVLSTRTIKGIETPLSRNLYFGLAVGGFTVASGVALGELSGGLLNPAISVGAAGTKVLDFRVFLQCVLRAAWQFTSAAIATGLFFIIHVKECFANLSEEGLANAPPIPVQREPDEVPAPCAPSPVVPVVRGPPQLLVRGPRWEGARPV